MLLAHLAYPNRLSDLAMKFGYTTVQSFIHSKWKHLLEWDHVRLTPERLAQYARTIERKGAPTGTVWGFIDGTIRAIARPTRRQRTCYNGWKRKHCLKYHAIVTPDGLISHLFGPQYAHTPDGTPLQVYGDPAYSISNFLLSPYQGTQITQDQKLWNQEMSRLRIVVEWAFKEMVNMFGFLDYAKNQKHLLQPVGVQFRVAALLHNAHITQYFEILHNVGVEAPAGETMEERLLEPPSLLEYFHH
ncbi:hypothetical protein L873DRAFT_1832100 [Choiromyces venosus 120613-1]|uniref:DDE Tnp4 domain-containing protein n=1 Tax=Choiromyces venosus 120613-1 TaxID=1336337 RepID=A0A3N4IY21_9PEZI|nr:hypothetical protein L873DRAFT_1832100 [Choiromyces venosus 120613-1]